MGGVQNFDQSHNDITSHARQIVKDSDWLVKFVRFTCSARSLSPQLGKPLRGRGELQNGKPRIAPPRQPVRSCRFRLGPRSLVATDRPAYNPVTRICCSQTTLCLGLLFHTPEQDENTYGKSLKNGSPTDDVVIPP